MLTLNRQAVPKPNLGISNNPLFLNPITDQVTFFNHIAGLNLVTTISNICPLIEYRSVVTLLVLQLRMEPLRSLSKARCFSQAAFWI